MTARTLVRLLAVVTMVVVGTTCGDTVDPVDNTPTPGWVAVRLTSPNTDDGGMLFTVGGAAIDSVRSSFPDRYFRKESATSWRVLIGGSLATGSAVAEIFVPDTRTLAGYSATILQVAQRVPPFGQRLVTGYGVTIGTP